MINPTKKLAVATLCGSSLFFNLSEAETAAAPKSPYTVSLSGSVGYDSNVYLVDQGIYVNRETLTSSVGASIAAKFDSGVALSYGVTGNKFWSENDEDNVKHVLGAAYKKTLDGLTVAGSTEFAQVQGDDQGIIYGVARKSTFTTPAPRERRDQLQNKSDLSARWDTAAGFVRGVGKLQYWDMQTDALAGGAENWRDRYDLQGGVDLGRAFTKGGPDYYVGYRQGYFSHDNDGVGAGTLNWASNHYERYLVGVDGKLTSTLKLAAQAGWSLHDYTSNYYTTKGDGSPEGLFTDITATWSVSKADELQFKTTQGRTVSSTSGASILVSLYQVSWKHEFDKKWSLSLTGRMVENDYDGIATDRDDVLLTGIAGVTYKYSSAISLSASITQDSACNQVNGWTSAQDDQAAFDRTFVSAGVVWKL